MLNSIADFLCRHRFPLCTEKREIVDALLSDMRSGLASRPADEDMAKTWLLPPPNPPKNKNVIVIDAGGTNFRTCLVSFDGSGTPSISDFRKSAMPGTERELSRAEFFAKIADSVDYLKNRADRIGFCFSYSMTITPDGDGIANSFSKEIKAAEVVGVPIGKTLLEELNSRGWNTVGRIVLLNDTVAALLAGAAVENSGRRYSSHVGFILGTGMNGAYIQPKARFADREIERQIVVCESGKFSNFRKSDFDEILDEKSQHRGEYRLEKCCSGAYLGPLSLEVLKTAAKDGIFSDSTAKSILSLNELSLIDASGFLISPLNEKNILYKCSDSDESDTEKIHEILDALVDRSAWYAANILAACVIQSGGGSDSCSPVCILCNGSTFYKTHKMRPRIEGYLERLLWQERGLSYEIASKDDDITLGTAIAALSK